MSRAITKSTSANKPKDSVLSIIKIVEFRSKVSSEPRLQVNTFQSLKQGLAGAAMQTIYENILFTVETDAPDFTIYAILNQDGRLVAFHLKTLQASEQHHS